MKGKTVFLLVSLMLAVACLVTAFQPYWRLRNEGKIIAVGVSVWKDSACSQPLTLIDWGVLYPNSISTFNAWIKNDGNTNITLNMQVANFTPPEIEPYFNVSWSYDGGVIKPKQLVYVYFILTVADYNLTYTSFSFDILVVANEV